MKRLLVAASVCAGLAATPVLAHDNNCDIDLQGDLDFTEQQFTITMQNDQQVTFFNDNRVSVDGDILSLNDDQQALVEDYRAAINEAVPMSLGLVAEGFELAGTAITEVFGQLLGADDPLVTDFQQTLTQMQQEVDQHFYAEDGSVRVRRDDFGDNGWMESQWEQKFEQTIEDMVSEATGKLLMVVGKEMLSGDGDMSDFEQRMESFGENLEQRIERQAEGIEDKAEDLCEVLHEADNAEQQLAESVTELQTLNLIELQSHRHKNLK